MKKITYNSTHFSTKWANVGLMANPFLRISTVPNIPVYKSWKRMLIMALIIPVTFLHPTTTLIVNHIELEHTKDILTCAWMNSLSRTPGCFRWFGFKHLTNTGDDAVILSIKIFKEFWYEKNYKRFYILTCKFKFKIFL